MTSLTRSNATLGYIVLVLLLGGASAAGHFANLVLQLLGAILIGWTLREAPDREPSPTSLRLFFVSLVVLAAVQFLPLPVSLWTLLPGREAVAEGFRLVGATPPWLMLSLAPWNSLASVAWWIPAMAIFLLLRAADAPPTRQVVATILAVAVFSTFVAALQQTAGVAYIYRITNYGQGVGFFANSNHQGSFLLVSLALWGGWFAAHQRTSGRAKRKAAPVVPLAVGVILIFGVLVSGSLACVILLVPVSAAVALILRTEWSVPLNWLVLGAFVLAAAIVVFLLSGWIPNDLASRGVHRGRLDYLEVGLRMLRDFAPFGSGLGTFAELYRWYEDPMSVTRTFANHAHNDFLELLIETGIFGLAALALYVCWFVRKASELWHNDRANSFALAASLAVGTELIHSLVDYPLRTAAMSSLVAACCAIMLRPAVVDRRQGATANLQSPPKMFRI